MQDIPSKVADGEKPPKEKNPRKTPWRNEPPRLRDDLYRAFGVDLTQVPGINTLTAQMLFTEVGPDLTRFTTAAAFCSWLRLCPDPKISGRQVLSSRTRPTKNRAALALRMGAQGLHHSQSFPGDYFRRMKARMGTPKAMTAAAHKLAPEQFHWLLPLIREPFRTMVLIADCLGLRVSEIVALQCSRQDRGCEDRVLAG